MTGKAATGESPGMGRNLLGASEELNFSGEGQTRNRKEGHGDGTWEMEKEGSPGQVELLEQGTRSFQAEG